MLQTEDFGVRNSSGSIPLLARHTYLNWLFPSPIILPTRGSRKLSLSAPQLLSVVLVLVGLVIQFFRPSPNLSFLPLRQSSEVESVKSRTLHTCPKSLPFLESFPISRLHKMTLLEEAKRVAAEFDYPAKEVNKGVKEFIRQMGWFSGAYTSGTGA